MFHFENEPWHVIFQQCGILTRVGSDGHVQPPFKLTNSKWWSVSFFQAISKGSDQTARMRRLIWGFAGRTYHIVGNLMYFSKSGQINAEGHIRIIPAKIGQNPASRLEGFVIWSNCGSCWRCTADILLSQFLMINLWLRWAKNRVNEAVTF